MKKPLIKYIAFMAMLLVAFTMLEMKESKTRNKETIINCRAGEFRSYRTGKCYQTPEQLKQSEPELYNHMFERK